MRPSLLVAEFYTDEQRDKRLDSSDK